MLINEILILLYKEKKYYQLTLFRLKLSIITLILSQAQIYFSLYIFPIYFPNLRAQMKDVIFKMERTPRQSPRAHVTVYTTYDLFHYFKLDI